MSDHAHQAAIEPWPEYDYDKMRPKKKLPDCPKCGEDELGMINTNYIFCYNCTTDYSRSSVPNPLLNG